MKLDQTAVTANPQDLPSRSLSGDRESPPRSASSLLFEGTGVGASVGGLLGALVGLSRAMLSR